MHTGTYNDTDVSDEFSWAAAELYIATGDKNFYNAIRVEDLNATIPTWQNVGSLAWISLAQHCHHPDAVADCKLITNRINGLASRLATVWDKSAYGVTMQKSDFVWGSNSVALNQAMMLIQAYRQNGRRDYLNAAQSALDYVLGRNAIGMSFVTGYGSQSPQHPHHRISASDGIAAPIPGMMVGGPQPGQQDKSGCHVAYPTSIPAKSYLDNDCSYASNEVAINWQAPLVYVSAALQVLTAP
jgi:endoglucanase